VRQLIASILAAGVLLAATAESALMATPTTGATCSADSGKVLVSFIYDASLTPPLITTVRVTSTDTNAVTVGITFYTLNEPHSVVTDFSGPVTPGTTNYDVTPFNQHMIQVISPKWGTFWAFPYIVSCGG
jgi:hypothetical protein